MTKLLAFMAHPDDEVYGIGGTLAKYAAEGVEIHIGIWLPTTTVLNYFPNGEFKFGSFSYEVNDVTHAYWIDGYCLGKDVYVEE